MLLYCMYCGEWLSSRRRGESRRVDVLLKSVCRQLTSKAWLPNGYDLKAIQQRGHSACMAGSNEANKSAREEHRGLSLSERNGPTGHSSNYRWTVSFLVFWNGRVADSLMEPRSFRKDTFLSSESFPCNHLYFLLQMSIFITIKNSGSGVQSGGNANKTGSQQNTRSQSVDPIF